MILEKAIASDFCESVFDGTHDSPKYTDCGYHLVTSKYLIDNKVDYKSAPLISELDYIQINKRSRVRKYDVLVSMIGTVGNIALITDEPSYAIKNIGVLRPKCELDSKYLFYYMQSPLVQEMIGGLLVGSTQPFLSLNQLRSFPIIVPIDNQIKQHIVNIVRNCL